MEEKSHVQAMKSGVTNPEARKTSTEWKNALKQEKLVWGNTLLFLPLEWSLSCLFKRIVYFDCSFFD